MYPMRMASRIQPTKIIKNKSKIGVLKYKSRNFNRRGWHGRRGGSGGRGGGGREGSKGTKGCTTDGGRGRVIARESMVQVTYSLVCDESHLLEQTPSGTVGIPKRGKCKRAGPLSE